MQKWRYYYIIGLNGSENYSMPLWYSISKVTGDDTSEYEMIKAINNGKGELLNEQFNIAEQFNYFSKVEYKLAREISGISVRKSILQIMPIIHTQLPYWQLISMKY